MKLPPPVNLPDGGTPAQRLDMAFRKVLTVPKEAILKQEAKERREREKKRQQRSAAKRQRREDRAEPDDVGVTVDSDELMERFRVLSERYAARAVQLTPESVEVYI